MNNEAILLNLKIDDFYRDIPKELHFAYEPNIELTIQKYEMLGYKCTEIEPKKYEYYCNGKEYEPFYFENLVQETDGNTLKNIPLVNGTKAYDNNGNIIFDKDRTKLYVAEGDKDILIIGNMQLKINNLFGMFDKVKCTKIDFHNIDMSDATRLDQAFIGCEAEEIDLSSVNIHNVTDMSYMFSTCRAKKLNLSSFDTHNVTNMSYMFYCNDLRELKIGKLDTSKAKEMFRMFAHVKADTIILDNLNVNNLENVGGIVSRAEVNKVSLRNFNFNKVFIKYLMIHDGRVMDRLFEFSRINTLDISGIKFDFNCDYIVIKAKLDVLFGNATINHIIVDKNNKKLLDVIKQLNGSFIEYKEYDYQTDG